jgi:D-alanyl-D-alanine dipeptidase
MPESPLPDSLPALRNYLASLPHASPRAAFESDISPVVGVEYRHLFSAGDSSEALTEIPQQQFARIEPHPYAELGAPYDGHSPFHIRQTLLPRLQLAQDVLNARRPGWSLQIFDAWRPLAVQRYMVEHEFAQLVQDRGVSSKALTSELAGELWQQVFSIWARPSADPAMPPPHSTGAAIDITLLHANGATANMGSEIDAFGGVSLPGHFANSRSNSEQAAHANRELLADVMATAGFQRHPYEWWHFSYGDQLWALGCWLDAPAVYPTAIYGGIR